MSSRSTETIFQLSLPGGTPGEDVLGLWQTTTAPAQAELAFASPGESAPLTVEDVAVVWRVNLPFDTRQANAALQQKQADLRLTNQDLEAAHIRLEAFASGQPPGGDLPVQSFGIEQVDFAAPEAELAGWLAPSQGIMSFALGISLPQDWQDTAQEALDFFSKVRQMLAHYAYVESSAGESPTGRTAVSWTGDFETLWQRGLSADQMQLHSKSIELALASRQAWVKMAMLVAQGAALFGLFSSTGNPLMIPAVYKFVRQVMEQYREIRRVQAITA